MKLIKLIAILASLAVFAWGCELDTAGSDTTNGGGGDTATGDSGGGTVNPCQGKNEVTATDLDLTGDGNCNTALFWDEDCKGLADDAFNFKCGKSKCATTTGAGICEMMNPCDVVQCWVDGNQAMLTAKPCPNDKDDCFAANGEPPFPCEQDDHCDTWCPIESGSPLDPDCDGNADAGNYCAGGAKAADCGN